MGTLGGFVELGQLAADTAHRLPILKFQSHEDFETKNGK